MFLFVITICQMLDKLGESERGMQKKLFLPKTRRETWGGHGDMECRPTKQDPRSLRVRIRILRQQFTPAVCSRVTHTQTWGLIFRKRSTIEAVRQGAADGLRHLCVCVCVCQLPCFCPCDQRQSRRSHSVAWVRPSEVPGSRVSTRPQGA